METLFTKLEKIPINEIPFLFPGTNKDGRGDSHFEQIIKLPDLRNTKVIDQLLALIIKIDKRGLIYNSMIDKNIYLLFNKGIDLKNYFSSSLVLHSIES